MFYHWPLVWFTVSKLPSSDTADEMIEFLYLFCIFLASKWSAKLSDVFVDLNSMIYLYNVQIIDCCRAHVITDTSVKTVKCERYKDLSYSAPNEREPNFDAFDYEWVSSD